MEIMEEFKDGDAVLLNSGSPIMTIRNTYNETVGVKTYKVAHCEWFMDGWAQSYNFQQSSLKHYVPKTQP